VVDGVDPVAVSLSPAQAWRWSMVACAEEAAWPVSGYGMELRITAGFHW
jgi:hypothetical protein